MNPPAPHRHLAIQTAMRPFHLLILLAGFHTAALGQEGAPSLHAKDLVEAAIERTTHHVQYDGGYRVIAYPMGIFQMN